MCGISGIIRFNDEPIEETVALKMRDSIAHRGPDDAGIYMNTRVALGNRRLSVMDVSDKGKQPFSSSDGRYIIVFNGEIYNYKEFVPELKKKGVHFRSATDTEVLLYLYIYYGPAMLNRLNGMWAFAVWDNVDNTLFLCRDRVGTKPLYYSIYKNTLYFASEQKALFTAGVPCKVEEKYFYEMFYYRYVAGENTFFKNVYKVLPGHYMYIRPDCKIEKSRYWHLGERSSAVKIEGDISEWFGYYFDRSVRYRMISDVPVGILLSGGLDSGSLAASVFQQGYQNINTYTISFKESELNETPLATNLAADFKFNSHHLFVEGDNLYNNLLKAIWAHDEPLIHHNDPHLAAIAQYSKAHVKVLLSGEGADELMGGYIRYKPLKYWDNLQFFSKFLNIPYFNKTDRFRKLLSYLGSGNINDAILLNASNFYPEHIDADSLQYRKNILKEAEEYVGNDPIKQALYLDQHTYMVSLLERDDRSTMSEGIECREPYLDPTIIEGLMSLPSSHFVAGKKGKAILMNSIGKKLPSATRNYKKIGLGVPWERYLRQDDRYKQVLYSLKQSEILNSGLFNDFKKDDLVKAFFAGDNSNNMLIRFFFFVRLWETEYYNKFS